MSDQRLSKLQRWIFMNWEIIPEVLHCSSIPDSEKPQYHSSFWVYQNFFNCKKGKKTFYQFKNGKIQPLFYQIPNKYVVTVYRSLRNLQIKGLIEVPFRGMNGRGHLIFIRTEKGLLLSDLQKSDKHLTLNELLEKDKVINNQKTREDTIEQRVDKLLALKLEEGQG